jgi:hypothetical protein
MHCTRGWEPHARLVVHHEPYGLKRPNGPVVWLARHARYPCVLALSSGRAAGPGPAEQLGADLAGSRAGAAVRAARLVACCAVLRFAGCRAVRAAPRGSAPRKQQPSPLAPARAAAATAATRRRQRRASRAPFPRRRAYGMMPGPHDCIHSPPVIALSCLVEAETRRAGP